MKYFEYICQCENLVKVCSSYYSPAVQMTELELFLHVYICQVVGMTEVTDVIFVFLKTNLLYIIFLISFVQINF